MSLLAALVLATASARVESVSLTTSDSRLAVRIRMTGKPGVVTVHREGDGARVSIMDAELGARFVGGRRFSWTPPDGFDPALLAATPAKLDRLEIAAGVSAVGVFLHMVPEAPVEVHRDAHGLLLVLRTPSGGPEGVAPTAPATAASTTEAAELVLRLLPTAAAEGQATTTGSVSELYARLFPAGPPQPPPQEPSPLPEVIEPGQETGAAVGPFRVRASLDARYVDADVFVESTAVPTKDRYLEVQPRVVAAAPLGEGRLTLDYDPVFRAFATYDDVNSNSHALGARVDLPVGSRMALRAGDRFRSGVLDTRVVDPGGEYFYGLGHFRRNDADAGASIMVGPRLSVELGGALGAVRFQEKANFFSYDTRSASAGIGFEMTPRLKAVVAYVYDAVPRPDERPQAEARAHSGQLTLSGDLLPLLSGEASVAYRSQDSPNGGAGGTSYSGLTMSAALTRQLGRESLLAIYASRSTPVSAYEENAFYVSTSLQGALQVPLPARLQLRGGLGYQWNDYRTVASAIGRPREDRILGWYVGLRCPVRQGLYLGGAYRSEDRTSNVAEFDTNASAFYVQLEWDIFGTPPR
jgi:hypothetical protein